MNCNNCTNSNALKEVKIKHVHGNVLRMAIPLTLRTIELVDGEINATDTPFVPSSEHPVKVVFSKGSVSVALDATMKDGNIAYIEEKGKIPVGTYAITVTCNDDNGNPYRFKQNAVLYVADATIDAGIEETIEYEVTTWYLDAAIFLALKGEDGVGIYDIETQSSGEIGGVNTVTFILTDGRTRSFNILNGSGAVDSDLDINSPSPVANSAVTAKFNELSGELADLFGDVDYDSSSKSIRFWDKGKTNVLASLDARPFIKDGMVSNAYISNNTLVITFNTDSGKEAIGVPLTTVFNPNNYYTKTQVDSRIASAVANINLSNYYTKAQTDAKLSQKVNLDATTGRVDASQATRVVLDYIVGIYDGEDEPSHDVNAGDVWYDNGQIHYAYNNDVIVVIVSLGAPQKGIIYCNAENNKTYRWTGSEFVQVGGGNSEGGYEPPVGGIPKSDLAQSVQDTLDDVSNKVDKVSGKGLSTEDYTTAEKQKLDGLSNYDDTEIQAEVDAKYEKPSTGIPKTDLSSNVQASLGKADSALQSSDLEGYATTDDVDDAVAALVSSAPQTLDTLKELADALGDDPNFATTMTTQLGNKVDKETGKGLSTNDYTTAEKTKLAGIAAGAEVNVQPNWTQTNTSADDYIKNKPTLATVATSGSYNDLTNKPTIQDNGIADVTGSGGVVTIELSNGNTYTIDLNHTHSAYATTAALDAKQDALTFDTTPTALSTNPVESGGVYSALYGKQDKLEAGSNISFSTNPSTGNVIISASGGGGTQVQADWDETDPSDPSYIANKPTIPTTASDVGALPASTTIPTKVSDLTNDSGFTSNTGTLTGVTFNGTSATVTSGVAAITATIPSKVSDLQNDSGFTTNTGTLTGVSFNGTSASVSNGVAAITASIPADLGDLTNNAGYTKNAGTLTGVTFNGTSATVSSGIAAITATIPADLGDLTNNAGYTKNTGTVTGISVNGGTTQQPTNGVVDLTVATGGDNDLVGLSDGTANDGAVVFTKRNGDTITLNLTHVHTQYYTKTEIDTMIGDIGTILASI